MAMPNQKVSKQQSGSSKVRKTQGSNTKPKTRKVKLAHYKSFRISKRIKPSNKPLTGSFRLLYRSIRLLFQHWRVFGGAILIYVLLTLLLVKGFGVTSGIGELKQTLTEFFTDQSSSGLITNITLFSVLLSNVSSASSEVAGAYQSFLLVLMSLVFIWTLRQVMSDNKKKVTVRDGFYKGVYPLIPFLLVLLVIGLQLLPLGAANFLYATVIAGGLAVTGLEIALWAMLIFLLVLLSLYMLTSSVFALYIVTLPDVRPMVALRSARELVRYRRWSVMRKVLFLPLALLVLSALIIIPILIVSPVAAEWLFFVMSMCALAVAHGFLYNLYREML
jgi:hypothetical protein